ncbi:MAG: hypothetical protein RL648_425 [Verrucomicrobiota bacterium]|jgi:uracil-DNA glycosylase family 4
MNEALSVVYRELVRRHESGERTLFLSLDSMAYLTEQAELAGATGVSARTNAGESVNEPTDRVEKPTRSVGLPVEMGVPAPPKLHLEEGDRLSQLDQLRQIALNDPWCLSQVKKKKKVVFGTGSVEARIFFCGEAPGAEEETEGVPFVGPAGQLLTRIINAMGLSREEVYIANIMTYRPPMESEVGNRAPTEEEMRYCLPYLLAQLELVDPLVVVALGRTAVDGLLGVDRKRKITHFRGNWQRFEKWDLMPTFHPSYLLRNDGLAVKRQVWEDMLAVMERVGMVVSDKQRGFFLK